jgi:hypothetical protein
LSVRTCVFLCFDACSHVFPGVSVCRCVSLYVSVGLDYVCCIIVRLVSRRVCAFLCSARASRVALVCVMILYDCSPRRCWHLGVQQLRQHQLAAAAGVLLLQGARPYLGPNMQSRLDRRLSGITYRIELPPSLVIEPPRRLCRRLCNRHSQSMTLIVRCRSQHTFRRFLQPLGTAGNEVQQPT